MGTIAIGQMLTPILALIFVCAALCLAVSCKFIGHGEVAFLPMVGIVVNVFYISTAVITLVASKIMWADGFVGAAIFSIMSLLSASIMAAWSYYQTQSNAKPAMIRKRLSWILLISYSIQGNGVQVYQD